MPHTPRQSWCCPGRGRVALDGLSAGPDALKLATHGVHPWRFVGVLTLECPQPRVSLYQIGIEGLYQPCNRRAHGAPPAPFVASGSCWPNPGSGFALPPEPGFAFGFFPFVDRLFLGSGELSGFLR